MISPILITLAFLEVFLDANNTPTEGTLKIYKLGVGKGMDTRVVSISLEIQ